MPLSFSITYNRSFPCPLAILTFLHLTTTYLACSTITRITSSPIFPFSFTYFTIHPFFSYFIILLSHIKDWPSYFCSSLPPSSSLRIAQWCPPVLCKRICMRHSHSRLKIHWKTLFSATPRMVSQIFFVPLRCNAGLPLLLRMKNHGYLHQQGQQHVPRHRNARVCR